MEYTIWKCTKCDFKTTDDERMLKHEHPFFDCEINMTEEQMDSLFKTRTKEV